MLDGATLTAVHFESVAEIAWVVRGVWSVTIYAPATEDGADSVSGSHERMARPKAVQCAGMKSPGSKRTVRSALERLTESRQMMPPAPGIARMAVSPERRESSTRKGRAS
jgi:hypothetical protein